MPNEMLPVLSDGRSANKSSVRPLPVDCILFSGFMYLMYSASRISSLLKSFSCVNISVLLTICSLFKGQLWTSLAWLNGRPLGDTL